MNKVLIAVYFFAAFLFNGSLAFAITEKCPPSVPEPLTLALFGIGLAGIGILKRKR